MARSELYPDKPLTGSWLGSETFLAPALDAGVQSYLEVKPEIVANLTEDEYFAGIQMGWIREAQVGDRSIDLTSTAYDSFLHKVL